MRMKKKMIGKKEEVKRNLMQLQLTPVSKHSLMKSFYLVMISGIVVNVKNIEISTKKLELFKVPKILIV
jgi:hypothetical protein